MFGSGEAGFVDSAGSAAFVPVVALGEQQFSEEPLVGVLFAGGDLGGVGGSFADGGQAQGAAGGVDRDLDGLVGEGGHVGFPPVSRVS